MSEEIQAESARKKIEHRATKEEVRERRRLIEELILQPMDSYKIYRLVGSKYIVSPESIKNDIAVIRRFWKREDEKRSIARRDETLRRYERKLRKTEEAGNWQANIQLELLYARVAGLISGNMIQIRQEVKTGYTISSRVNAFLARIPLDEQRQIAESLALAQRGERVQGEAISKVPIRMGDSSSPGVEFLRPEKIVEGDSG